MTQADLINKISEPDRLISPQEVDTLLFHVSALLGDYEETLSEQDKTVALLYDQLAEKHGSDAAGKRKLALTDEYREMKKTERNIRLLKAMKGNLRRRFSILTNQF
jgi:uncharacterized coiled-coil protein SlyX